MWALIRDKLLLPLVVGVAGFVLGVFGDEIKDRLFPPETSATIKTVQLQRDVTLGDYLKVTRNSVRGLDESQLASTGIVVFADVKTTGYKGDELHLDGRVLDARTDSAPRLPDPVVWGRFFRPDANKTEESPDIWIRDPCKRGRYYASMRITKAEKAKVRQRGPTFTTSRARCRAGVRP